MEKTERQMAEKCIQMEIMTEKIRKLEEELKQVSNIFFLKLTLRKQNTVKHEHNTNTRMYKNSYRCPQILNFCLNNITEFSYVLIQII